MRSSKSPKPLILKRRRMTIKMKKAKVARENKKVKALMPKDQAKLQKICFLNHKH